MVERQLIYTSGTGCRTWHVKDPATGTCWIEEEVGWDRKIQKRPSPHPCPYCEKEEGK